MLALMLITFTIVSSANPDCTRRFGRCYRFFDVKMTWIEAIEFCRSSTSGLENGLPVIQRNSAEANFIDTELLKNRNHTYWLGLFTVQSAGGWTAVTNEALSWTQWHSGQISSSVGEPCAISAITNGQRGWNDETCTQPRVVVCESREILCNCQSGILQWYEYDTKQKILKKLTKWCCCSKATDIYYSKISSNNIPFPLIKSTGSRSSLECAAFCARTVRCSSFRYLRSSNGQCLLYESTPILASQRLPRGRGGSFKCL